MKSYSSRELIQIITEDGWYFARAAGDHHQYKHPTKPGKVTISHPVKDVPVKTVRSIFLQAGLPIPQ